MKAGHWLLLSLTGAIIVLLLLAPHHPENPAVLAMETSADEEPPNVENLIDSALGVIASPQPMQGILMLRQIADDHPENFRAQYNLGLFSAKTGQWEKVIERFEMVEKIDPEFVDASFWLGKANFELGKQNEARIDLARFLAQDPDNEQLKMEAQTMLKQIK